MVKVPLATSQAERTAHGGPKCLAATPPGRALLPTGGTGCYWLSARAAPSSGARAVRMGGVGRIAASTGLITSGILLLWIIGFAQSFFVRSPPAPPAMPASMPQRRRPC